MLTCLYQIIQKLNIEFLGKFTILFASALSTEYRMVYSGKQIYSFLIIIKNAELLLLLLTSWKMYSSNNVFY